jgi:hypothetical protein
MRLKNVSYATWLRSHLSKPPRERWLRELYPWPVIAQVDCGENLLNQLQSYWHNDVEYRVTLKGVTWQADRGTFRYRLSIECDGLGWHARSYDDHYDLVAAPDGTFVTLFHAKKVEPLEKIAKAFFARRWHDLAGDDIRTLAVSRFLSAALAGEIAEDVFASEGLEHYPESRISLGSAPMFAAKGGLWVGYRFFSEHAHAWARRCASGTDRVVALYFADTTHQFLTDLPANAQVHSIAHLDAAALGGKYGDLVLALLRKVAPASGSLPDADLARVVLGQQLHDCGPITEEDVYESLAALKCPCNSKGDLAYQLSAGVLLNAWIDEERRLGFKERKAFYAFKQKIRELAEWAVNSRPEEVVVWVERTENESTAALHIRVDGVDFGFHAVPLGNLSESLVATEHKWSGIRLKPMAPLVLDWGRRFRASERSRATATPSLPPTPPSGS